MQGGGSFQTSKLGLSSALKTPQQMSTPGTHFSQVRTAPAVQQAGKAQGVRQQPQLSEKTSKAIRDLNSYLTENARQER